MISSIQAGLSSIGKKITDFSSSSVIGVILAAFASIVDELSTAITVAQSQAYISSATSSNLDAKAADYGLTRKQATYAQWIFVATVETPSTSIITIPAGSVVTTTPSAQNNNTGITFTVNTDTQLPVGSTSVNIPVTCTTAGSVGNISPGTQLLWGSAVPGIDGVQFNSTTGGTAAIDTETDTALRARVLAVFTGALSAGTATFYQSICEAVEGVASAIVVSGGTGTGIVDIYIAATGNTVPTSTLLTTVQSAVNAQRIITDNVVVQAPASVTINATLNITVASGYDPTATSTNVQTAIENYISSLGIGGGSAGVLPAAQLVTLAMGTSGVQNATTTFTDTTFSSSQLPIVGTITVTPTT